MKKRFFVIASVALTLCFLGLMVLPASTLAASKDKPIVWKVQTPWPQALWQHKAGVIWAQDVEKLSGGRMKIDL